MTVDTSNPSSPESLDETLARAVAHQHAGEFQEAGLLYQAILQANPAHAMANHNFGVLAVQVNQPAAALPYLNAALDAEPSNRQFWLSYIDALHKDGQLETARQILALARERGLDGEEAITMTRRLEAPTHSTTIEPARKDKQIRQPKNGPSPKEVRKLTKLFQEGQTSAAANMARTLTERFPDHWIGWKMLGATYNHLDRNAEAIEPMQRAAALAPNDVEVHSNLGLALLVLERYPEAEASFRKALQISPKDGQLLCKLGHSLQMQRRYLEAEFCFRRAIEADSNDSTAYIYLAEALRPKRRLAETAAIYRQAIAIEPNKAIRHSNLGKILYDLRRFADSEVSCRRALQIEPKCAAAHNNLGLALKDMGRLTEAEASFRQAIECQPDMAETFCNLGNVLHELGDLVEAEKSFRIAIQLEPDSALFYDNLLHFLSLTTETNAAELFAAHRRFGELFEVPLRSGWLPHSNPKDPERRLNVGFVSGDFFNHAIANFIGPLLGPLSQSEDLELHSYYTNVVDDPVTQQLRTKFTHWNEVAGLSEDELADKIRMDGIDILIDLSGHTAHNRLMTFAQKPAPIQASWMGYPGTTGLTAMDYFLADRFFVPSAQFDDQFTEKIVRLPAGAPFLPNKDAPPISPLPALANGYVTFGSFNRINKIGPSAVALWSSLLHRLPDARMLLGGMPESGEADRLIELFIREGIARGRLEIHPRCDMRSYLNLHERVDICLDAFPYNGGTTTLHALWMGVPTLTLAGNTVAGRSGATVLGHVGLDSFVALTRADYVREGVTCASDLAGLSVIRAGLRERFAQSAQAQPELIAAGVKCALRTVWRRWCAGLPAESFEVRTEELQLPTVEGGA